MGTDYVKINDREYIHKLIDRVEDEYQREEEKKSRELQENEKRRLRRLLSDGVITPEEISEMDSQYKHEHDRELRTPPPGDPNEGKLVTEKPKPFIYFDKNNKKKLEETPDENQEQEADAEKPDENGGHDGDNEEQAQEQEQEQEDAGAPDEEGVPSHPHHDHVDPLIDNLREGKTVDELYSRAEQLLRGVSTQEQGQ